jgi:hypothetical protein
LNVRFSIPADGTLNQSDSSHPKQVRDSQLDFLVPHFSPSQKGADISTQ